MKKFFKYLIPIFMFVFLLASCGSGGGNGGGGNNSSSQGGGKDSTTVTINFDLNGGTYNNGQKSIAPITMAKDNPTELPRLDSDAYHQFQGWYMDKNLTQTFNIIAVQSSEITVYAKFTNFYKIETFNYGYPGNVYVVAEGEKCAQPVDPKRDNYEFVGWFSDPECTQPFDFNTPITRDISIYSGWTIGATEGLLFYLNGSGTYTLMDFDEPGPTTTVLCSIPEKYNGIEVTAIGSQVFKFTGFLDVYIPKTVTRIGAEAFCANNVKFYVDSNNPVYETDSNNQVIIEKATKKTIASSVRAEIPSDAKIIGAYSFRSNIKENLVIPEGVEEIEPNAFENAKVKTLTLPTTLKKIGYGAFWSADLTSLVIPDNVEELGEHAFELCYDMTSVTIGNGIKKLPNDVFARCEKLTEVTFGNGLEEIGDRVFDMCYELEEIEIPEGVISIGEQVFANCSKLEVITLASTLQHVGILYEEDTTPNVNYYTDIHGSKYLGTKDNNRFLLYKYDTGMSEGIVILYGSAFPYQTSGAHVTIADSVKYIMKDALNHGDYYFTLGSNLEIVEYAAFSRSQNHHHNFTPGSGNSEKYAYFANMFVDKEKREIVYGVGLSLSAFAEFEEMLGFEIESIADYAYEFGTMTSVEIPEHIKSIGKYAFASNDLRRVDLHEGLEEIGDYAFAYNTYLNTINIPNSVTSIGHGIINSVDIYPSELASKTTSDGQAQYIGNEDNPYIILLQFTDLTATEYTVHSGCKFIYDNSFKNANSLKSVTIPEGVVSIGKDAFRECSTLEEVTFPNSLKRIEEYAFYNKQFKNKLSIPDTIQYVNKSAFDEASLNAFTEKDHLYYLGNEDNPYLVLVSGDSDALILDVQEGCKIIANIGSVFPYYIQLSIPKTVNTISTLSTLQQTTLDIYFDGTIEQFKNIIKDEDWMGYFKLLVCTDGIIGLSEAE